jgi:hypothetical protein
MLGHVTFQVKRGVPHDGGSRRGEEKTRPTSNPQARHGAQLQYENLSKRDKSPDSCSVKSASNATLGLSLVDVGKRRCVAEVSPSGSTDRPCPPLPHQQIQCFLGRGLFASDQAI